MSNPSPLFKSPVVAPILLLVVVTGVSLVLAVTRSFSATTDRGIEEVVNTFQKAIIAKDKKAFLDLFWSGGVNWVGTYGDASLAQGLKSHPERAKVFSDTPAKFIDSIVGGKQRFEETFSNISVVADDDIASVNFDYIFLKDDTAANRGKESWQLVRTADGWKINSIVFSVNF